MQSNIFIETLTTNFSSFFFEESPSISYVCDAIKQDFYVLLLCWINFNEQEKSLRVYALSNIVLLSFAAAADDIWKEEKLDYKVAPMNAHTGKIITDEWERQRANFIRTILHTRKVSLYLMPKSIAVHYSFSLRVFFSPLYHHSQRLFFI